MISIKDFCFRRTTEVRLSCAQSPSIPNRQFDMKSSWPGLPITAHVCAMKGESHAEALSESGEFEQDA